MSISTANAVISNALNGEGYAYFVKKVFDDNNRYIGVEQTTPKNTLSIDLLVKSGNQTCSKSEFDLLISQWPEDLNTTFHKDGVELSQRKK